MNRIRSILSLILIAAAALAACQPATPAPLDAPDVVQQYYDALNAQQLDTAMTFIAEEAVFVNPYGKFTGKEDVRASLQLVIDDGITFDLSNLRDTNGRVLYDYQVKVNGEVVEVGTNGLSIVADGQITLDATESTEWAAYVNRVEFSVTDAGYEGPESVPAGWTDIVLANNSQGAHHVQLVRLADGKTPNDLRAALTEDGENFPAWATPYGGPNAPDPGGTASSVIHLDAGSYAVLSVIPNAEGVPGFLNGMLRGLTVTAAEETATREPAADLTIDLTEFALGLSGPATAGQHLIRVNNMGLQVHEAYLVRLNDGVDVETYLNTPPTEPPPAVSLGGITGLAPGQHQYISVWLEPGNYALLCFFPDPASHAPHFALGMVHEFTVE